MPNNSDFSRGVIEAYKFILCKLYEWVRDVNTKETFNFIWRNQAKKMHWFGKLEIYKEISADLRKKDRDWDRDTKKSFGLKCHPFFKFTQEIIIIIIVIYCYYLLIVIILLSKKEKAKQQYKIKIFTVKMQKTGIQKYQKWNHSGIFLVLDWTIFLWTTQLYSKNTCEGVQFSNSKGIQRKRSIFRIIWIIIF